jgi:anti-anti-sigma regulatory factor
LSFGKVRASLYKGSRVEDFMLAIRVEKLGDLTVVECKGRIVRSDTVFELRDAVMEQDSKTIVLDLSEVQAIGGGGLGMLALLERWARKHDVHLKLFSPSKAVMEGLVQNRSILDFEIAGFHEMMGLLGHTESRYSLAA